MFTFLRRPQAAGRRPQGKLSLAALIAVIVSFSLSSSTHAADVTANCVPQKTTNSGGGITYSVSGNGQVTGIPAFTTVIITVTIEKFNPDGAHTFVTSTQLNGYYGAGGNNTMIYAPAATMIGPPPAAPATAAYRCVTEVSFSTAQVK